MDDVSIFVFKRKVNGCPKRIDLEYILRNFYRKKIIFLTVFYISHESVIKVSLNGPLTNTLRTTVTITHICIYI